MWKWGAFAIFGGLLLALIIYVKVFEEPIDRHVEITQDTITGIVTGILGAEPDEIRWSGYVNFYFNERAVDEPAQQTMDAVMDVARYPEEYSESTGNLESAIAGGEIDGRHMIPFVRANMVLARIAAVTDDYESASATIDELGAKTKEAVETAVTVEHWLEAQGARLLFIESVKATFANDGWSPDAKSQFADALAPAEHREALASALHNRFIKFVQPKIVEYSATRLLSEITAKSLYEEPTKEESELIGVLLHRHPKGFSPEVTAESGAESLRQLMSALEGPWSDCQPVLDEVAKLHAVWFDYREVMQMNDSDAIVGIKNLKLRLDKLENPVGMAILHEERTSWSNLVQAAYVADAKEVEFKISLLKLAGSHSEANNVLDPLTGAAYEESGSNSIIAGDNYSFIKAFIAERQFP